MITRVVHIVSVACLAAAALLPQSAAAQPAERRAKIATLWPSAAEIVAPYVAAFEEGLAEHGWQNADVIHYFTDKRPDALTRAAREIVATHPDVIWTPTNLGAIALQRATRTIPVVIGLSQDPVGVGLIASPEHPGGNITGMAAPIVEIVGKRIELLKEVEPELQAIAVLYSRDYPGNRAFLEELRNAAGGYGVALDEIALRGIGDFDADAIAARTRSAHALIVLGDNVTFPLRQRIADMAIQAGLTTIAAAKEYCESGMLLCFGYSLSGQFRQSSDYVDRILRGADPALLPVRYPTAYELTINLSTAKALHFDRTSSIAARADDVIE